MPAPGSGIDVENLVFSIPGIEFELNLSQPIKSDAFQEASPGGFHDGLVRGFHKCAGIAEIDWILPSALGHERSIGAPVFAYRTEGKLILSPSGNTLLNQNFLRRNVSAHLSESSTQLGRVVGRQSFDIRLREEMMIDGGF